MKTKNKQCLNLLEWRFVSCDNYAILFTCHSVAIVRSRQIFLADPVSPCLGIGSTSCRNNERYAVTLIYCYQEMPFLFIVNSSSKWAVLELFKAYDRKLHV